MCPENAGKRKRRKLIEPEANVPRMAREGVLVTTKTTVSRETRRRTSADWFNQKQVCRGRIERENKWLLAPICAERHGEGLAETGSNRGKCAAEGTREGLVTNSTNVSRETQSWRNGGDWLNQKQVFRGRHEREDRRLLVPISPEKHGEEEKAQTDWTRNKGSADDTGAITSDYWYHCVPRDTEKTKWRTLMCSERHGEEEQAETDWARSKCSPEGTGRWTSDYWYQCIPRDTEKDQCGLVQTETSVPWKDREGGQVITSPNLCWETRKRTSGDWFEQRQICRGRHERGTSD